MHNRQRVILPDSVFLSWPHASFRSLAAIPVAYLKVSVLAPMSVPVSHCVTTEVVLVLREVMFIQFTPVDSLARSGPRIDEYNIVSRKCFVDSSEFRLN